MSVSAYQNALLVWSPEGRHFERRSQVNFDDQLFANAVYKFWNSKRKILGAAFDASIGSPYSTGGALTVPGGRHNMVSHFRSEKVQ